MPSLNRVVLIGRLTRDPEMKYTPQGIAVAQMSIAVDRFTKDENGERVTDFFNLVAWRRTAEYASNYLGKGRLIAVDGRLQTRSWTDQASGQKRTTFEIVAENIESLDRRDVATPEGEDGGADMGMGAAPEPARSAPESARSTPAPARSAPASGGKAMVPTPEDTEDEADPFADE